MNEEIARILQMLDDGKVSAAEAEKLIRAVKEEAHAGPHGGPHAPAHEPADLLRALGRALRAAMRRQQRIRWWQHYKVARWHEEARRRREARKTTAQRVEYVLRRRAMADPHALRADARLREDLEIGEVGCEVLRCALEYEFGFEIPSADVDDLTTVQSVIDYVERRRAPSPNT